MATEDLIYLLDGMGIESGVDLKKLVAASRIIAPYLDHPLPGRYLQACLKQGAPIVVQSTVVQ
jgi:isopropylmalate/homocitrate/citramalate synthase